MNILFVNNFRGRGGGEEFLRDLLPGLVQKGVKVGLVCRPGTPLVEMFRKTAVNLYPIRRSGDGALTSVYKVANIIRSENYEIVDIQRGHDIIQSWIGALLSGKKPVLFYTPQVPEFIKSRFLLGRMDRIISVSRYIAEKVQSFSAKTSGKMAIINYGIDLSKFKPGNVKPGFLRNRFGLSPDTEVIGTVGDLWKNQIEFLDALVEIRKEFPGVRFVLVASESGIGQVRAFKQRALELRLSDSVLWTGRLSKDEMLAFYADIDIAVSTHRNEGFGIWLLEALAMGKPVVAFNAGGVCDPLEGCPAGVLVNGGSKEMADEIIRILKDNDLRGKMSEAGPRWIRERFDREHMVEKYLKFFKSVL
jgi:glycosyltransferase involved in cell wall biosynthesis